MLISIKVGSRVLECSAGQRLHELLGREANLETPCGGQGRCGKCIVRFVTGTPDPVDVEHRWLTDEQLAAGFRLSCQHVASAGMELEIPATLQPAWGAKTAISESEGRFERAPWVHKVALQLPPADTETLTSQERRFFAAQAAQDHTGEASSRVDGSLSLLALRSLASAVRETRSATPTITPVTSHGKTVFFEPGDTTETLYGAAIDVGTTSMVCSLVDLNAGTIVATVSDANPQSTWGADVVSRMEAVRENPEAGRAMQSKVVEVINSFLQQVAKTAHIEVTDIYALTAVGNTVMMHLLLAIDPSSISVAPFTAGTLGSIRIPAARIGIKAHPAAVLTTLPCSGSYLGADAVGVTLASGLDSLEGAHLAIDIGTNGELVLGVDGKLYGCATAAGPAFEGAQIACGSRARPGAIDRFGLAEDKRGFAWTTIGHKRATSICGSGLLDIVAALREAGVIDASGRIHAAEEGPGQQVYEQAVGERKVRAFHITDDVYLTQQDIRQLQLAKGAIRAGAEILMREAGITAADLDGVLLAGTFGNYLKPESAVRLGTFPEGIGAEDVRPLGNAAITGGRMALLSEPQLERAMTLSHKIKYVELSTRTDFQEVFMVALGL